jgi:hypothetical protein
MRWLVWILAGLGVASVTLSGSILLWVRWIHPAYLAFRRWRRRQAGHIPDDGRPLDRAEHRNWAALSDNYSKDKN